MATILLPPDFKEFLQLLNAKNVEYLLIGGYAVGYHGYVRATADMDVWLAANSENAHKVVEALHAFGFTMPEVTPELFLKPETIIRMGVPPLRIELLTQISGVEFDKCYRERISLSLEGIVLPIISLHHLKANKQASGRSKDFVDLEHLP